MLTEKRRCTCTSVTLSKRRSCTFRHYWTKLWSSSGEKYRNGVLIIWRAGRPLGWALPRILVIHVFTSIGCRLTSFSLNGRNALLRKSRFCGAHQNEWMNEDRHILSAPKCRIMIPVSRNIRYMPIFARVPRRCVAKARSGNLYFLLSIWGTAWLICLYCLRWVWPLFPLTILAKIMISWNMGSVTDLARSGRCEL